MEVIRLVLIRKKCPNCGEWVYMGSDKPLAFPLNELQELFENQFYDEYVSRTDNPLAIDAAFEHFFELLLEKQNE